MLHFIEPPELKQTNKNNNILYWKLTVSFPNANPLEFKCSSLAQLANVLGIKETTLRKIIYKPAYHSKKYHELLKYVSLTPQYT